MIRKIQVNQYRKLKDLSFDFDNNINIISGTNGTCKTSILHLISNSFQTVNKNVSWLNDGNCIEIIKK